MPLKSKTKVPPGGWKYLQPETGWSAPRPLIDSFEQTVDRIIYHRKNNPRFNLPRDRITVADQLDTFTCYRLKHDGKWCGAKKKENPETSPLPESSSIATPPAARLATVAPLADSGNRLKFFAVGASVLREWLGAGGKPVPPEQAEARSAVCQVCPLNERADWLDKITGAVASTLKRHLAAKHSLALSVTNEDDLGVCSACGCHLPLKIWTPIEHILNHTPEEDLAKFVPQCWIRVEKLAKVAVVLPFFFGDASLAISLLRWIRTLDGRINRDCVLVTDCHITPRVLSEVTKEAKESFSSVEVFQTLQKLPDERWPIGPNWLFETALTAFTKKSNPFLWLEPDCVPLRSGWLDEIETEYAIALNQKRTILAHVSRLNDPRFPESIPSGVAVYKAVDLKFYNRLKLNRKVAWDIQFAREAMLVTHPATTIYSRLNHQNPPTFEGAHPNTLRLNQIPKTVALFHPNKDGTLIGLIRARTKVVHTQTDPELVTHDPMEPSGPYDCRGPEKWNIADYMTTAPLILAPKQGVSVSSRSNRIIHCVQRWKPNSLEIDRRIHVAVRSWIRLYMTGEVVPRHVWPPYERDARGLGDARNLPFLRDVIKAGLKAGARPDDIFILTNDDNVLHPDLASVLFDRLAKQPCLCAGRLNYKKHETPEFTPASKMGTVNNDIGRDLFAFRADWLKNNFHKIPDMIMGEAQFDIVLSTLIRQTNGVPVELESRKVAVECELPFGWVKHEEHERGWMKGHTPAQNHNNKTAAKWYREHKLDRMVDFE